MDAAVVAWVGRWRRGCWRCGEVVVRDRVARALRATDAAYVCPCGDGRGVLRLSTRIEVVVLRRGGAGRAVTIGNRCRIVVPCWLRDAAAPDGAVLVGVGAESDGEPVVLLASTRLLTGFADAVARGL